MTNEHTEASMTQELRKLATDAIAAANGDWMHTEGSQGMARERALVLYTYAANPEVILSLLDRLEKAEKDAERYRWLRNGPLVDGEICEELYVAVDSPTWPGKWALVGSDLDKAVDAMEASK